MLAGFSFLGSFVVLAFCCLHFFASLHSFYFANQYIPLVLFCAFINTSYYSKKKKKRKKREHIKHIEVCCHFIREKVEPGFVSTPVRSKVKLANVLTKILLKDQLPSTRSKLGTININVLA